MYIQITETETGVKITDKASPFFFIHET